MSAPIATVSSRDHRRDTFGRARRYTIFVWLCGVASLTLPLVQSWWEVFHPHYLPLCILFAALAVSTMMAFGLCLWRVIRGPQRLRAMELAVLTLIPAGVWAMIGYTAYENHQQRKVPNTLTMRLAKVMGATLMRAEIDLRYRHRLETDRLVMFYNDLKTPESDLAEMDRHLARMEELLGEPIAGKPYWVRGQLLGQGMLSVHGLSLGTDSSATNEGYYNVDRHELAHAALDWFRPRGSDPPCVLHEGWAMSQCGDTQWELAHAAADWRSANPSIGLREMFGPDWYHQDSGPVYPIGGAFVDFLIRTYRAPTFRRFATECQADAVEAKCQELFDSNLETLETKFWQDVERTLATSQQNN